MTSEERKRQKHLQQRANTELRKAAQKDKKARRAHEFKPRQEAFEAEGITNIAVQELVVVATFGILLWGLWRVSRLGYRVNEMVGVALEVSTLGAAVTLLAISIPAWAAFRQTWLTTALLSPLHR